MGLETLADAATYDATYGAAGRWAPELVRCASQEPWPKSAGSVA